ncbi:MAG: acyltransferase [Phenylobacterium sp.]|jgi:peptidoglycan/LPS O-acetylase OafA/YrhL|uniref:acyltransferase family protein n=1 Tax=Phenylobacterium sp. TaxID=1871053 RepID=UPI0025DAB909|nr:acyltransferase [Phenylobacterium sp.]MCG9915162.1 acyltransferase [Phenylobacterium sp.]
MNDRSGPIRVPFPDVLDPLTGVRFFLALGVVLFHYQLQWTLPDEAVGLLDRARLGVDVFFILSGFILTHVYLQGDGVPDYRRFLAARFARIYPAHLFILLGMLGLVLLAPLFGVGLEPGRFNPADFAGTLLLVQAWFPRETMVLWNGPAWSLSAEWFAYLAFPAYAALALRLRARPWVIIALAAILFVALDAFYRAQFGRVLPRAEDSMGILRIVPEFLYGIGLYYLGQRWTPSPRVSVMGALATTAALLTLMQLGADDRIIVAAAGPFVLSLALLAKARVRTCLSHPVALFAGEASFALYLVHIPILMVWRNAAQAFFGWPGDYRMGMAELAAMLVLTLAAAAAIHVFVERPGRRLLRAWMAPQRADPVEARRSIHSDQGEPF